MNLLACLTAVAFGEGADPAIVAPGQSVVSPRRRVCRGKHGLAGGGQGGHGARGQHRKRVGRRPCTSCSQSAALRHSAPHGAVAARHCPKAPRRSQTVYSHTSGPVAASRSAISARMAPRVTKKPPPPPRSGYLGKAVIVAIVGVLFGPLRTGEQRGISGRRPAAAYAAPRRAAPTALLRNRARSRPAPAPPRPPQDPAAIPSGRQGRERGAWRCAALAAAAHGGAALRPCAPCAHMQQRAAAVSSDLNTAQLCAGAAAVELDARSNLA